MYFGWNVTYLERMGTVVDGVCIGVVRVDLVVGQFTILLGSIQENKAIAWATGFCAILVRSPQAPLNCLIQ